MSHNIKIIMVDDNPVFLDGIRTLLSKSDYYEVIGIFTSGTELLERINEHDPDLVLIDIEMPGMNGIDVARAISRYLPDPRLIAISMYHDGPYIEKLVECGFRGYVSKNRVSEDLNNVIEKVMNGGYSFPQLL